MMCGLRFLPSPRVTGHISSSSVNNEAHAATMLTSPARTLVPPRKSCSAASPRVSPRTPRTVAPRAPARHSGARAGPASAPRSRDPPLGAAPGAPASAPRAPASDGSQHKRCLARGGPGRGGAVGWGPGEHKMAPRTCAVGTRPCHGSPPTAPDGRGQRQSHRHQHGAGERQRSPQNLFGHGMRRSNFDFCRGPRRHRRHPTA